MLEHRNSVAWLAERDIDLLLAAESYAEQGFAEWFFAKCGDEPLLFEGAWVSVSETEGESDLVLLGSSAEKKVAFLVENKILASFQPEQDERYRARARRMVSERECDRCLTVLIAPQVLLETTAADFDVRLAYEQIAEFLDGLGDGRSKFTASALRTGIEAKRLGYIARPNAAMTSFWSAYHRVCEEEFPTLRMAKPNSKPAGSTFCYFHNAVTHRFDDRTMQLVHKWTHGFVDLQFPATSTDDLETLLPILPQGGSIAKAAKSACVRINVPSLVIGDGVEAQIDKIRVALTAAVMLQKYASTLRGPRR